jgi:hypothetical protein
MIKYTLHTLIKTVHCIILSSPGVCKFRISHLHYHWKTQSYKLLTWFTYTWKACPYVMINTQSSASSVLPLSHKTAIIPTKSNLHLIWSMIDIPNSKTHIHISLLWLFQRNCTLLRPCAMFCTMLIFHDGQFLAPHLPIPHSQFEDHSLLAVCIYLSETLAVTFHIWKPFSPSVISWHFMLWW